MNIRKLYVTGLGLGACMMVSACSFDTPTYISTSSKAEVHQDSFSMQEDTAAMTPDILGQVSKHFRSHGNGSLNLNVVYDPESGRNTAKKATEDMTKMVSILRGQGVQNIQSRIMPVQGSGDISQTIISYASLTASAPSDCGAPMSMDFANPEASKDYKLGCSVETYFAKQIARPADLLGNDNMDNSDGRRISNAMEVYSDGKPNSDLKGDLASEK